LTSGDLYHCLLPHPANGLGRSSRIARSLKRRAFKIALLNLLPFGLPWQRKPLPNAL
jgi:hypothetical protein